MSSPIAQIEAALVERLRKVRRAYTGLTVESYGAELDDELFGWVRTLPATWVTFGSMAQYKRTGARTFKASATFEVLVAQRNLSENAGRQNTPTTGADVGVYALLEDNKLALVNQLLGLGIQPITPGAIRPVMKSLVNREAVVVYAQEFHTEWMEVMPEAGAIPDGDLVTIGLNYFLKPQHSTVSDPADKTDLITTRQIP